MAAGLGIRLIQGIKQLASSGITDDLRADKTAALVIQQAHARFQEAVLNGQVFTMTLNATTTGVAAGNIVGAAAAAATQFALFNPVGSGVNLVLWKFGIGIISGTPAPGSIFHGVFSGQGAIPTLTPSGTLRNNLIGEANDTKALGYALAAGAALTGGAQAPVVHSVADFASTATAQASTGLVKAIELIDGAIIIPPGCGWIPLWSAAGTTLLNSYSITYEKVIA